MRELSAPEGAQFVPADALPPGENYEAFIERTGTVPTRDNLHDFFNAQVWRRFPQAKRRMNALHVAELSAPHAPPGRRGPLRDALTVFDENGAVLHAPVELWHALQVRAWQRLFIDLRPLWQQARLTLVGHALLEQLTVAPRKPLTAHVLCAPAPADEAALDAWLAGRLHDADWLRTKPFTPLPVLGVPGWCKENTNFSFYDDSAIFRPRRAPENNTRQGNSAIGTA
ncbi:MAG: DUF3025 domain-containing protein [Lysobacteraceae bacterium]|nr:MAG: DUF3025 domain-containing protein [Xanthomonadaceae bacterium]